MGSSFDHPDGSWEDGPGHLGGLLLPAGVAAPHRGALLPQVPLDRGDGALDPGAQPRRHQPGGEQERYHVGPLLLLTSSQGYTFGWTEKLLGDLTVCLCPLQGHRHQ